MNAKTLILHAMIIMCTLQTAYAHPASDLSGCCQDAEISSTPRVEDADYWEKDFLDPPEQTKPYVYWYWDNGNISKEGISKDLKAMAAIGIGEAMIGNIVGRSAPNGGVRLFSEEWWDCMVHAVCVADSLGMKIGVFNSPGWSQSGGPWVTPDKTMRYLHTEERNVQGPGIFECRVPDSNGFQLVAVQAYPTPESDGDHLSDKNPEASSNEIDRPRLLLDGDLETVAEIPEGSSSIEISLDSSVTIRSARLAPAGEIKARCTLEAMNENGSWFRIRDFDIKRNNSDKAVGPMVNGPVSINFSPVTSRKFRVRFDGCSGGRLAEIDLGAAAAISMYVEKQLGKMSPDWEVTPDSYRWPETVPEDSKSLTVDPSELIDLRGSIRGGTLKWNIPDGRWTVQFTGMLPTGMKNSPTTPEGSGLEIDKMNKEAVQFHFDAFIGELLRRVPQAHRKAVRHVVADSYEKGPENWTDGFAQAFTDRYGYDPLPWLPVLTGRIVGSSDKSERFLWDMRRLVADRIASEYVGGLRECCERNGLRLWIENYGHWGFPGEFLNYGGASHDIGGEFWQSVPTRGSVEVRCATSAGHIYGKNVISAEAFTSHWSFSQQPEDLKLRGDWAWSEGINHFVLHVYLHQPHDAMPGLSAWFGTDFNRNNTWFASSKSYIDYLRRSSALLQSGRHVADIAYYIGEDTPKMTGDRRPAPPKGYDYDFINAEVLMDAQVCEGRVRLKSGADYAVLVLPPDKSMRPKVIEKLETLLREGACIVGDLPEKSPSAEDYPQCDSLVADISRRIGEAPDGKAYGKGKLFPASYGLKEIMLEKGLPEDCLLPDGMLYTHRSRDGAHLYFLSNQSDSSRTDTAAFRISGMQPELWNPVNGEIRALADYECRGGMTFVPLHFNPREAFFIVFRGDGKPAGANIPKYCEAGSLGEGWSLVFKPAYASPFAAKRPVLGNWAENEDPDIRYFSGTATYGNRFRFKPEEGTRYYLDLGEVGGMARVRLNGKEFPTLWCQPYRIDITEVLKRGVNTIEIDVVNCWWNRLVGDTQPGVEPVTSPMSVTWSKDSPLLESGLTGPVRILYLSNMNPEGTRL